MVGADSPLFGGAEQEIGAEAGEGGKSGRHIGPALRFSLPLFSKKGQKF